MDMPLNELLDRYTIHLLKNERTTESQSQALYDYERAIMNSGHGELTQPYIDRLYDINRQMWDAEAAIRAGEELGLEEVGRRALVIRDLNRIRIGIKNEIATAFNSGYLDVKVNYAGTD